VPVGYTDGADTAVVASAAMSSSVKRLRIDSPRIANAALCLSRN
jgi:hypothetical protein